MKELGRGDFLVSTMLQLKLSTFSHKQNLPRTLILRTIIQVNYRRENKGKVGKESSLALAVDRLFEGTNAIFSVAAPRMPPRCKV